jgi:hypothetical protein
MLDELADERRVRRLRSDAVALVALAGRGGVKARMGAAAGSTPPHIRAGGDCAGDCDVVGASDMTSSPRAAAALAVPSSPISCLFCDHS